MTPTDNDVHEALQSLDHPSHMIIKPSERLPGQYEVEYLAGNVIGGAIVDEETAQLLETAKGIGTASAMPHTERLTAQLNGVLNCLANSQREVEQLRSLTPKVELVFQNESGCGYSDPFVAVYVNDVQYDKVWAYIDKEKGADGGWYSVVKFRRSTDEH